MTKTTQTITAAELTKLTGLTDRRFRQLANDGFSPPGKRGVYEYEATIAGLFKFYQSLNDPELKKKTAFENWRGKKIANDYKTGRLIDAASNDRFLVAATKGFQAILRQKLINELPSNAAGQDAPAIRILSEGLYNRTIQELKKFLKTPELRAILDKHEEE
jgi:hypothetical protein